MSGFDLPPINGFDLGFKRSPLPSPLLSPELSPGGGPGLQGPQPLRGIDRAIEGGAGDDVTGSPFSGLLADSIDAVKGLQDEAHDKVRGLVLGDDVDLHEVMIAGSKSEVAFNLLLEVRNKLVDAWEKLSRSSV